MTRRIIYVGNPLEPQEHQIHEVTHYGEWLKDKYGARLPEYVVLYHEVVSMNSNVTPRDEAGIEKFLSLEGDVYVVEHPHYWWVPYLIYALILIAVMVQARKAQPNIPNARNQNSSSSNNDLAQRTNKPRPNSRIPDIFGEVISVPDMLSKTYSIFRGHEEYEVSYMCIGRGSYEVSEVKDDTTLIADIDGASCAVYGPNTSPNFGVPQLVIGDPIDEPLLSVVRTEAVNGQVLVPPNDDVFTTPLKFRWPNQIVAPSGSGIDFTELYVIGDVIDVTGSWFYGYDFAQFFNATLNGPGGSGTIDVQADGTVTGLTAYLADEGGGIYPYNMTGRRVIFTGTLAGIYPVVSDDGAGNVVLADPELVNPAWSALSGSVTVSPGVGDADLLVYAQDVSMTGEYTIEEVHENYIVLENAPQENGNWAYTYVSGGTGTAPFSPPNSTANITLALDGGIDNWVGPFDVQLPNMTGFIVNVQATNGMYRDDGTTQSATSVIVELEYTPIDLEGSPLGQAINFRRTIQGSAITTQRRAITIRPAEDLFAAPAGRFRMRRLTPKDTAFSGQIVDEVQWKDLHATSPITVDHFGDVTTVMAATRATSNALSVKNRKLNMRVTRKLRLLTVVGDDYELSDELEPTRDAADILAHICLDPKIGGRPAAEIDFVNFRETSDEIQTYFNRESPRYFNYTFDDDNVSFEETITAVADAIFCTALRRGNVIQLHFERATEDAQLIFNHRTKVPKSEKRTWTWGTQGHYDGIEYEYVDRADGSVQTIYLPEDRSAVRPKSIRSIGVMGQTQAILHAYRTWNKLRYQRLAVEFTATQEGELVQRNMPILVANNIRTRTQDGEVKGKVGLVITTSQPVRFETGVNYAVYLQAHDATVQLIGATAGATPYEITLEEEPAVELSTDPANYALATYVLVPDSQIEPTMFLVEDRSYESRLTSKITAINYDPRYYAQDNLFEANIAYYSEEPIDTTLTYDTATEEERRAQAFYAEDTGTIPTEGDPGYVYAESTDDGEL